MPQMAPTEHQAIQRVRRVATGILLFLIAVFAASFIPEDPPGYVRLLRAMSEAGIVGGLADWFAIEALFRRPLGLPIPHTALLPNNQQRAATNIARFVDENFLTPEQLLVQITKINPVHRLATWMSVPANAQMIARELSGLLHLILRRQIESGMGHKAADFLSQSLFSAIRTDRLGDALADGLKHSVHGPLLDKVLEHVRALLIENNAKVAEMVHDRSRWWIAAPVDKKVVRLLVDGMASVLDELSEKGAPMRQDFEASIVQVIEDFRVSGVLSGTLDENLHVFAETDQLRTMLAEMIQSLMTHIERDIADNPERFAGILAGAMRDFAQHIVDTPELTTSLNARLETMLERLLDELRPAAVLYITQTISTWDSRELVARIETEVGRDLQFIRINGSVLGAVLGGIIFAITQIAHLF